VTPGFAEKARLAGLDLGPLAAERLERYRDLLVAAAAQFNLTAVRDPEAVERRHLLESLALVRVLAQRGLLPPGARLLDVGSGAGLPGLPMKIARPDLAVGLLEANAKRCAFLREAIAALGLGGVEVLEGRAEDLARDPARRGAYDLVVARAVAPLPVLLEYALPFLRLDGHLAATKGSAAAAELAASPAALAALGGALVAAVAFEPPSGRPQTLVLVRKSGETPGRYPRRAGVASRRPLG
jgi:16S rRNA (guanine527-N7)-methyltransferase